jgi:hypothetical protein
MDNLDWIKNPFLRLAFPHTGAFDWEAMHVGVYADLNRHGLCLRPVLVYRHREESGLPPVLREVDDVLVELNGLRVPLYPAKTRWSFGVRRAWDPSMLPKVRNRVRAARALFNRRWERWWSPEGRDKHSGTRLSPGAVATAVAAVLGAVNDVYVPRNLLDGSPYETPVNQRPYRRIPFADVEPQLDLLAGLVAKMKSGVPD